MTTPKTGDTNISKAPSPSPRDRSWVKPRLVSYGPISKLTQGASGSMSDGLTTFKNPCL